MWWGWDDSDDSSSASFEDLLRELRRERNFVPPFQQQEERITTSDLIRSWSFRTTRLCLAKPPPPGVAPRTLTSEVMDRHPGSCLQTYLKDLAYIFENEIACDLSFRVAETETVIRTHRCIVAARCPRLFFDGRPSVVSTKESTVTQTEISVLDGIFTRYPYLLRIAIASCYGVDASEEVKQKNPKIDDALKELMEAGYWANSGTIVQDLSRVQDDPPRLEGLPPIAPPDVCIMGSFDASPNNEMDWKVDAHIPILAAHSEYFRAALTHSMWTREEDKIGEMRLVRLDSRHFEGDTVRELVSVCYGALLDVCHEPLETILQLTDAAVYLGLTAAVLLCEEALALRLDATNLPDMIQFAQANGAQLLLLECHKYLCRNLGSVKETGSLSQLQYSQMEAMLQSNFVETPEDDILEAVLTWSEETGASYDETKELVGLVRLPFVPVDDLVMAKAVERNLVGEDMLRVCRLFQTDGDYRETMMNSEPFYLPRQSKSNKEEISRHIHDLERDRRRRMSHVLDLWIVSEVTR